MKAESEYGQSKHFYVSVFGKQLLRARWGIRSNGCGPLRELSLSLRSTLLVAF